MADLLPGTANEAPAAAHSRTLDLGDSPWTPPAWIKDLVRGSHQAYRYVGQQLPLVHRAQLDGIEQVAPILVALHRTPAEAKRRVGPAPWRDVHRSTLAINVKRARILLRTTIELSDLLHFPKSTLDGVVTAVGRYGVATVVVAGTNAKNRSEFREALMLLGDGKRMGLKPNPKWSINRLRKEHDRMAMEFAMATASPEPWDEPWSTTVDGYTFTLLKSAAEFSAEGLIQRHCIASYAESAKARRCVVMKIEGPERATVRIGGKPLKVQEVKARFNTSVSAACLKACAKICQEHFEAKAKTANG